MKKTMITVLIVSSLAMASSGFSTGEIKSKSIRATEISQTTFEDLDKGVVQELIVEFRQGDELPVYLEAQGDLLETTQSNASIVVVKKDFWVKFDQKKLLLSFDGQNYQPFKDLITGSFTAGSTGNSSGVANVINLVFKASIR